MAMFFHGGNGRGKGMHSRSAAGREPCSGLTSSKLAGESYSAEKQQCWEDSVGNKLLMKHTGLELWKS